MNILKQVATVAVVVVLSNSGIVFAGSAISVTPAPAPAPTPVAVSATPTPVPVPAPVPAPGAGSSGTHHHRGYYDDSTFPHRAENAERHNDEKQDHDRSNHDAPLSMVASLSGNTLTVTSISRTELRIGTILSGNGIIPGTRIIAFGTGRGGVGTYTVGTLPSGTGK